MASRDEGIGRDPSIDFRKPRPSDWPALISAIERINTETEFLGKPGYARHWADRVKQQVSGGHANASAVYIVATSGSEIIGYLGAFTGGLMRTRSGVFVRHIGVRQTYRGQGIGTGLFASALSWAQGRRAHRLELRVDEDNAAGLALYQKIGFRIEGRISDAIWRGGGWKDQYWMGLVLQNRPESHWDAYELSCPAARQNVGRITFRAPQPDDARLVQELEYTLLRGSPFHLRIPTEVPNVFDIASNLTIDVENSRRFMHGAFLNSDGVQRMVGYLQAWTEPGLMTRHDAMFRLDVLPAYSGNGVGRKLIEALEAWARRQNIHRLTTWVQAHNVRGLRFGHRCGFQHEVFISNYALINGRLVDRIGLGKVFR